MTYAENMPSVMVLVLLALAVAKVTWLIVDAAITMSMRQWVVNRFGEDSKLSYLVHCPGCSSVWVAAPMTAVTFWTQHPVWVGVLAFLAVSQVGPMVMSLADRIEAGGG